MSKKNESLELMKEAVLKVIIQHKVKPLKKSPLSKLNPRLSIVGGGVEKIVNIFDDRNGESLGFLLTESAQPSGVNNNPYVNLTKSGGTNSLESKLAKKIMTSSKPLDFAQVLDQALKVCKDDYYLATLTIHNLMKEITYAERTGQYAITGWDADEAPVEIYQTTASITAMLCNLRPKSDPFLKDKMAIWYHAYGALFVGGVTSHYEAKVLVGIENFIRNFWGFIGAKKDEFKIKINSFASDLSSSLNFMLMTNLYVPKVLSGMSKVELQKLEKELKDKYSIIQNAIMVPLSKIVNHQDYGEIAISHMETTRENLKCIYDEVFRVKDEISKRIFDEIYGSE